MKLLYTSILAVITLAAQAQPSITMAGSAPMPGDSFVSYFGSYLAPGPAGANQTWDFSGLIPDSTQIITFVAPSSTTNGASFPTADVAQVDPNGGVVYFDYDNGDMEYVGTDAGGILVTQTDPEVVLDFPLSFGTTWTDTQAGTLAFGTRSGTTNGNADAYGTLTLPSGVTVNNVLRVHLEQDYTDLLGLITVDYDFDTHWFYVEGTEYPLLMLQTQVVTPSLGPATTNQFAQWLDPNSIGIEENISSIRSMRVYPVPSHEQVTIEYDLMKSETVQFELIDIIGRICKQGMPEQQGAGLNRINLNVDDLPAGQYQLRLRGKSGASTMPLMVN